jgi:tetratricopeptide (TPR) repeat protein
LAAEQYRRAVSDADALVALEPHNAQWLEYALSARVALARLLLGQGTVEEVPALTNFICQAADRLTARDPKMPDYRSGLLACLSLRARLALRSGAKAEALNFATRASDVAGTVHTTDIASDRFGVAGAYWRLGNVQQQLGNREAAQSAWTTALAAIPPNTPEQPAETALHAAILQSLGRSAEAQPLISRLNQLGYRDPQYTKM